jgi:hypothetical protein
MSELIANAKKEIYNIINSFENFEKQKILLIIEVLNESSGTLMPENKDLVEKGSNLLFEFFSKSEGSNPSFDNHSYIGSENIYGERGVSSKCSEMESSTYMITLSEEMKNAKNQIMKILQNLRNGNLVDKILSEIVQETKG